MIKPNYTNLNDEEKKGIMVLDEEEKEYVIFLSADLIFVRVFLFLDVQLTLSIFSFWDFALRAFKTVSFSGLFW